jgi:hypothetical protein
MHVNNHCYLRGATTLRIGKNTCVFIERHIDASPATRNAV